MRNLLILPNVCMENDPKRRKNGELALGSLVEHSPFEVVDSLPMEVIKYLLDT